MERKNTVLLTVIAVATLLVAVVGATFAYFTATNSAEGDGNKFEATTDTLGGSAFTFNGSNKNADYLRYPGGLAIIEAEANLKESQAGDTHNYITTYGLEIQFTNATSEDLVWELYESDTSISDIDAGCQLAEKAEGTTSKYWYNNDGSNEDASSNCDLTNTGLNAKEAIASGTLKANTVEQGTINSASEEGVTQGAAKLAGITLSTKDAEDANQTGKSKFYYLVVKYANKDDIQANQGKKITANLVLAAGTKTTQDTTN